LETKLTPDQLCEKARQHEKENTWFQRLVILICIGLGAILGLLTVETEQLWVRRGFAWMFSGAPLPAPRLVDAGLALAERWADNRRPRPAAS